MTLNQIFDSVKHGEEYMREKSLTEAINRCYDEELDMFYASKRAKQLTNVVFSEGEEAKVNRIISKIGVLEGRIESGKVMSDAYRKMQTAAIMEDCKALCDEATKSRKVDSRRIEAIGRIVGATKFFIEEYFDEHAALKESSNPLLNKFIVDEKTKLASEIKK